MNENAGDSQSLGLALNSKQLGGRGGFGGLIRVLSGGMCSQGFGFLTPPFDSLTFRWAWEAQGWSHPGPSCVTFPYSAK